MPLAMGSEFRVLISNLPYRVPFSGSRAQLELRCSLRELDLSAAARATQSASTEPPAPHAGRHAVGNDDRRRGLASQLLKLPHGPLHAYLGGGGELLRRLAQRLGVDLERYW